MARIWLKDSGEPSPTQQLAAQQLANSINPQAAQAARAAQAAAAQPKNMLSFGFARPDPSGPGQASSGPQANTTSCLCGKVGCPCPPKIPPPGLAMGSTTLHGLAPNSPHLFAAQPNQTDTPMTNNPLNTSANHPTNGDPSNPYQQSRKRSQAAANIDTSQPGSASAQAGPPTGVFSTIPAPRPVGRPRKQARANELSPSRCDELLRDPDNADQVADSHSGLVRACDDVAAHPDGDYHVCAECVNRCHRLLSLYKTELLRSAMLPLCAKCTRGAKERYPLPAGWSSWSSCRCPFENVVETGASSEGVWNCLRCRMGKLEKVQVKREAEEEMRRGVVGVGVVNGKVETAMLGGLCCCGAPLGGGQTAEGGMMGSAMRCAGCGGYWIAR